MNHWNQIKNFPDKAVADADKTVKNLKILILEIFSYRKIYLWEMWNFEKSDRRIDIHQKKALVNK